MWEEGKKKKSWICPDFWVLTGLSSSWCLEAQTCLDWLQTWWAHFLLWILRSGYIVWDLGQWRFRFESSLLGRTATVSAQSSFGRRTVWVGKRCPIELIFGQYIGNSYVYLFTKFRVIWICGLRAVHWLLKRRETVISLSLLYLTSCGCCWCCRWATRRSVM
jgi:hypothetical protein